MKIRIALTILIISNLFFIQKSVAQEKISLNKTMLFNFSTIGDAGLLIDEQGLAGNPAANQGGEPITTFSTGWVNDDIYYPVKIAIDLGVAHSLSEIWFYDTNDSDTLFIAVGDPSGWVRKQHIYLNTFNQWRGVALDTNSRFILLEFKSPSTRVSELVLYGTPLGTVSPPPLPALQAFPKMENFMGVNGFINDPISRLSCVGSVREYHNWGWDEGNLDTTYVGYPDNQYAWNPSWVSGPGWGFYFDTFYEEAKNQHLILNPALQGTAPYIIGFIDSLTQHKPISPGEDAENPASYIEHADYLFQFAARYGKTSVDPTLLKLKPDNESLSGLALLDYIENWNEPDKWWFTRGGYFSPIEFAAMSSADYDGHEGSLGVAKGAKKADPTIKMVMGGLAQLNLEYIRCMKLWSDYNRQSGFPADVLNFHHYSNNGIHGISPEEDSLKYKLEQIVNYRNTYLKEKEIWLSEFGYDTNPDSDQASIAIDTNDTYEVQGQWIMRSYLAAAAAGIDKAHVFMLRDVNALNPNTYNSSGLTGELWFGHQPKKSWYYVYTMKSQLSGLTFKKEITSNHSKINIYHFESSTSDTIVYAVWCSTSENLHINDYTFNIGFADSAFLVVPVFGDTLGTQNQLSIVDDHVIIHVSERPVFVRTTGNIKAKLSGKLKRYNSLESSIPYSEQSNFYVQLFDDQHDAVSEPLRVNNSTSAVQNDFEFYGLNYQTNYTLKLWEKTQSGTLGTSWLWNNWGGTTALDALIISYMVINSPIINPFPWLGQPPLYSALFREVADVSNNLQLTALDALILNYRSVGFPDMAPFPGGRHNFQVAANFMDSINQSIYPNSPEIIFEAIGEYLETAIDTTIYYSASLEQLQNTENQLNIYITATGDVNASLNFQNTQKTIGVQELDNDFNYIENQQISIPFYFNKSVNLAAFSIEIAYEPTKLELISLEGIDIYTFDKEHGIVKLVWLDQKGNWFSENEPVFSIVAKIKGDLNDQSPFQINLTKTEFVSTDAKINPTISLKIPKLKKFSETDQFITNHYCVPNPFSDRTNLYFSLETEGQVELKIKDISGKIIYTSDLLTFTNGQHPLQINKSELPGNGIYIYTLIYTNGTILQSLTGKMIVM